MEQGRETRNETKTMSWPPAVIIVAQAHPERHKKVAGPCNVFVGEQVALYLHGEEAHAPAAAAGSETNTAIHCLSLAFPCLLLRACPKHRFPPTCLRNSTRSPTGVYNGLLNRRTLLGLRLRHVRIMPRATEVAPAEERDAHKRARLRVPNRNRLSPHHIIMRARVCACVWRAWAHVWSQLFLDGQVGQ